MTVAADRIDLELQLLRTRWPSLDYVEAGRWVRIPEYPIPADPAGWNRTETDGVFQILDAHPGQPPYGLYVPAGIQFNGGLPAKYQEPAANQPPFGGDWGIFSWTVEHWQPAADIHAGSNLLNWVVGFSQRFKEGV